MDLHQVILTRLPGTLKAHSPTAKEIATMDCARSQLTKASQINTRPVETEEVRNHSNPRRGTLPDPMQPNAMQDFLWNGAEMVPLFTSLCAVKLTGIVIMMNTA